MEAVTKQHVLDRVSLMRAIDLAADATHTTRFDRRLTEVACHALTLYHVHGREDVDEVSEMLSGAITDLAYDALERGAKMREALIDIVVDVFTMKCNSPE